MKSRQRRSFSAEMKARIAVEAIKGQKTIQEIASHYGVHPSQVTNWKRQAIQGVFNLLVRKAGRAPAKARKAILSWQDAFSLIETSAEVMLAAEIGRASCRERV